MEDERENARFFGGGGGTGRAAGGQGGRRGDPMGYYEELGLEPGASKQEVQAAFRGLALRTHPDKVCLLALLLLVHKLTLCLHVPCHGEAPVRTCCMYLCSGPPPLWLWRWRQCGLHAGPFLCVLWEGQDTCRTQVSGAGQVPESEKAAAVKRFQRINEAYSVLRDPAKRQQYDRG